MMSYCKLFMAVMFFNASIFAMNFNDLSLDVQIAFVESLLKSEIHKCSYTQNKQQLVQLQQKKERLDLVEKHAPQNRGSGAVVLNIQACKKQKLQPSTVFPPSENSDDLTKRVESWLDGLREQVTLIKFYAPKGQAVAGSELKNIALDQNRRRVLMEKQLKDSLSSR